MLVGEPVLLDCRVTGTPEIMVEWRKNGQILETNDAVSIDMFAGMLSSVSIEKAEESDSGIYSCFASNSFGTAEVEVEVFVTSELHCKFRNKINIIFICLIVHVVSAYVSTYYY